MNHSYGVIVAARTGSTRLPGKALLPLKGVSMLEFLFRRLKTSRLMKRLILATTELPEDDVLAEIAQRRGIDSFRGSRDDVVERFVKAAATFNFEYVVRITGDCPFVDGPTLDHCLRQCEEHNDFDLATTKGQFPVGIDFEIYKAQTMADLYKGQLTDEEREHLTLPIYHRAENYNILKLQPPSFWPSPPFEFTVDTEKDYQRAKLLMDALESINFKIPALLQAAKTLPLDP